MGPDRRVTALAPVPTGGPTAGSPPSPSRTDGPTAGPPLVVAPGAPRRRLTPGVFLLCLVLTAGLSIVGTTLVLQSREWTSVFREDFHADAALGDFPGEAYADRFTVYPDGWSDTSGRGRYAPSRVLSVSNGRLQWDMHTADAVPLGAAVLPTLPTYGQTYGRYSVRFRAEPVSGFGLAFLLWPDSEKWPRDGEIDFPEGELSGTIKAVAHHADVRGTTDPFRLTATFTDWHVATVEWRPGAVTFLLDGEVVGTSTTAVPSRSMHWVLQTGSDGPNPPDPAARARIEIDWLEAEEYR
jgi:hypothetical protein